MIRGTPPQVNDDYSQECPKCHSREIQSGYGLAFGGFGSYKFCGNDECDWFYKIDEEPEEDVTS